MANGILKYTSRDYDSINTDLVDSISALTDIWTSRSDGDPGIVLVKLMSALGDMLSYNFDKQALEYYAPTVTQRKNAAKLFELIGYKMHWYRSALTTLKLLYQPSLETFMMYCKSAVDVDTTESGWEDTIVSIYYSYRLFYNMDEKLVPGADTISVPPIQEWSVVNNENTIVKEKLTPSMLAEFDGIDPRPVNPLTYETPLTIQIGLEPDIYNTPEEDVKDNEAFRTNAMTFKSICDYYYKFWKKDNGLGIHTYLGDPQKTLDVYSNDGGSVSYSLIPTINATLSSDGTYNPTIYIPPFEDTAIQAIQGYLCSTTFTGVQLKDNRFYVPDAALDEDRIYISYTATNQETHQERTIFLTKVDNLLAVSQTTNASGESIIYFQFGVDDFDYPYVEISSYWSDILQDSQGGVFTLYYFKTQGKYGNITKNCLTQLSGNYNVVVSNTDNNTYLIDSEGRTISSPGYNPQTAADAYVDSINYVMTYNTLVTIYDFARFTRRQDGISNATAIDNQRSHDLNNAMEVTCNSYTLQQLIDILGPNSSIVISALPEMSTDEEKRTALSTCLFNIRRVLGDYKKCSVTVQDAVNPVQPDPDYNDYKSYGLNMYPIVGDFTVTDSEGNNIATLTNSVESKKYPYYLYKIYTSDDPDTTPENYAIETQLSEAYDSCRIVNVKPDFTAARVFKWRACGTLHLTKSVSQQDANNIIKNVVAYLKSIYGPRNMEFGKKITYMEVIDAILNADSRIRYFDAGIGSTKLIDFQQPNTQEAQGDFFNIEAYFNDESIMQYVQTYEEIVSSTNVYKNYISVDPSYIYDRAVE